MSVCVLQNLEKYRVLWTDFLASCREGNPFSVSKIGPEPAKPTISLALLPGITDVSYPGSFIPWMFHIQPWMFRIP